MASKTALTLPKRLIIFDLDGVIYRGDTPTVGSAEVISRLREEGYELHFLTNNSSQSRQAYSVKLQRMGIDVPPAEIMTSAYASALYLSQPPNTCRSALVVGEGGLVEELQSVGIRAVLSGQDYSGEPVDAVVVGIDRQFTYQRLFQAQQAILHGARFIATNRDPTFPTEIGDVPGGGSIVAAIETASGQSPFTVGKPNTYTLEIILETRSAVLATAVMVGDRLDTDIDVGRHAGMETVLTLTGVTTRRQLEGLPASKQPTAVVQDLRRLPELLTCPSQPTR